MTTYTVHIHREMRFGFGGIEAASHEEAAAIAREMPTEYADESDDRDGEIFYALVEVNGHKQQEHSRIVDFEPERLQLAAPKLLMACRMIVDRWEQGDLAEAASACAAAVAEAEAPANVPASAEAAPKPYSVLLLYPDWANDGGAETYYAFVNAPDSIAAVAEAERQALETNEWPDVDPADFAPLLVTEGRNFAQPLFKNRREENRVDRGRKPNDAS